MRESGPGPSLSISAGCWLNRGIHRYLYLLRHAKSCWDNPALADLDRPLTPRGQRTARRLADHFKRAAIRPEVVLCSSATRALQTLEPIAAALGLEEQIRVEAGLYGATAEQLLARLRALDKHVISVLVVGHNPGLQDLAIDLVGDNPEVVTQLREKFPTGGLAVVTLNDSWQRLSPGTAHVNSITVPRQLPS